MIVVPDINVPCYLLVTSVCNWRLIDGVYQMRLSEEPSKPSRVLHLRGLPADTTEAEITQLTTLFGIATNIILTRHKCQVSFTLAAFGTYFISRSLSY